MACVENSVSYVENMSYIYDRVLKIQSYSSKITIIYIHAWVLLDYSKNRIINKDILILSITTKDFLIELLKTLS